MGLTANSTGRGAIDRGLTRVEAQPGQRVIALAGNPNTGKSTVFNALTGLNQHTGNWPGKTVTNASGTHIHQGVTYHIVDLPGTYSLQASSVEEEVARDFISFGGSDAVIVVCDATCLERNLNLVLQTIELAPRTVVCINLLDEASRKKIEVDLDTLSRLLGVPVVGTSARAKQGLTELMDTVAAVCAEPSRPPLFGLDYGQTIEQAISQVEPLLSPLLAGRLNSHWASLRLLEEDTALPPALREHLALDIDEYPPLTEALVNAQQQLADQGLSQQLLRDQVTSAIIRTAENIYRRCVSCQDQSYHERDRRLDKLLTSRRTGTPIMLAMLAVIFWLTITGANYPSQLLSTALFWVQDQLTALFHYLGAPEWLHGALVLGVYRVLAWVISVMLPPMAIFFPLFTLLEDFGYLPRVAFNLDHHFKKACACGKQALTMCMSFGCNAAGIIGCRIIDSPRERLIAILTNNFVPCNGRFPTLILLASMFFVGAVPFGWQSMWSALILVVVVVLGILMTFLLANILSHTLLKGTPSSFTLELPPYRRPQIASVVVRSIFDRTLFVLGRAVVVAAPAGLVIWLMANMLFDGQTLLSICAQRLDPFARLLGMDGVILLAFILGFPANEIVIPIMIMAYMATNTLLDTSSATELHTLLVANGWTWVTAVSTMLFCLMHWPCSTSCLTIYKETQSLKWTLLAIAIPTVVGMFFCFVFTQAMHLLGF